jgi:organic radical activating enzyme
MNLKLYFTNEDYNKLAGPDWPSYESVCAGVSAKNPEIQTEIDGYIDMLRKDGIKFPIDTATACQSKWTWSTIYLNQLSTASCHRVIPIKFDLDNFDNFHNVPKKIADRQLMLNGLWPKGGCEYCQRIENSGGHSDRQFNLEIRGLTPPELEIDPTAVYVSPRIVEIFAHNTCNLSCIYCNGNLSSQIERENLKHGDFRSNGVHIPVVTIPTTSADDYLDRFVSWLDRNITTLSRLHLLGGETFLQHDLMNKVLEILENRPSPKLEFCLFSNLNVPDSVWNRYIPRILDLQKQGHIKYFDLTASIDCWGAEQEYVRSGLDLNKFEQRFAWAADQDPAQLRLNVNQTVTNMTIKTMPQMIEKIKQYSRHRHIGQYFEFYIGSQLFQHPDIFAYSMWEKDFENIIAAMPHETIEQQEAIPRMIGLQRYLQKSVAHNHSEIKKLHVYLDELDRRRGTDWQKLFSYLKV